MYSVVLTAFNASQTIARAIESALNLDIPPVEIIIIDDCSIDSTREIVERYCKSNSQIRFFSNKSNSGQSFSRNFGSRIASQEYLIFMDDDDSSLPHRAKLHLEAFEKGYDLSYVSTAKVYVNGYTVEYFNSNYGYKIQAPSTIIRNLIIGEKSSDFENLFSPSCALAVRRQSFLKSGGFREDMRRLEDIDFVCRALTESFKVSWSSEIGVIRFDTSGADKKPLANAKGELMLINTFEAFFSRRERIIFKFMIRIRESYFERSFFKLLLAFPKVIALMFLDPKRILSMLRRLRHDFRARNL